MRYIIVNQDSIRQDGHSFPTELEAESHIMVHAPDQHHELFVVPEWDSRNKGLKGAT